jgi:phosphatidylinositol 3,5-bisphosphate 5-phosphatase
LEIVRTTSELEINEDPNEYGTKDIRKLISQLKFTKSLSAYGLVGFVKFLETWYMILVTKRHKIGFIGNHTIYTIKDTTIYKICPDGMKSTNPLEAKYLKMFMNVDLSSNFYFSYSYDLTRTLQYNLADPKFVGENAKIDEEEPLTLSDDKEDRSYAFRSISRKCFVWNEFLQKPMQKKIIHKDWMLELIHGFVNQSSISIFGLQLSVCLIARRSKNFAGTRFLKRGANSSGDVANAVETEQIVTDGNRMSSFVQFRGSVPAHWSQDISKMVPKPPISLDIPDPYAETAGKHFEKLLFHHGAPVIILNLVKKREKRKHESILTDELANNVKYLNQFLPANVSSYFSLNKFHLDFN